MKLHFLIPVSLACASAALAQNATPVASGPSEAAAQLPQLIVYSPRVANQTPVGTFTMPVSALRFEPRVDLQGRNLVESQADVTIRGGIFENTGIGVGALTISDPQTGHYLTELPIAPQMFGAPEILTGAELAMGPANATVGAVTYDWRPIQSSGSAQAGIGPHALWRSDVYQGYSTGSDSSGRRVGVDAEVAHSESNGPIAFGDHRFDRANARLQLGTRTSQTDIFAGYQAKFFGWPNLYTPFNRDETENIETLLLAVNHRVDLGGGDFLSAGAYHRRNKDDYAFDRFAPLSHVHPYQHTTWEDGAAIEARRDIGGVTINARAEMLTDFLKSTTLTYGHYRSRTLSKLALVPERSWPVANGDMFTAKAGLVYDDSNRDRGAASPVAELARTFAGSAVRRVYVSYAQSTQVPSYTALNSSPTSGLFRGNPNLGREKSRNLEVGVTGSLDGWTINAAVFARRDNSLVDWTFVGARTANAIDVETTGIETVLRRSWRRVDLVFGYTALTKNSDYRGAAVNGSFYALNYARQRLTAAATVRLGHGFELRVDNAARIQAPDVLRTAGGDHAVLSTVALAYQPTGLRGIEFTAQMDNVWNSRFQEIPGTPATPRQWSVGASYVW